MSALKKLAGQTAIYGLSSIVGRLLNYFLVPLHTRIFAPEVYGIVTEFYAYVVFLQVVLTYGMETAFFRYAESEKDWKKVYSTSLISLFATSALFVIILWFFVTPIAKSLNYSRHPEYIIWFAFILAIDAYTSIPFAKLRQQNKALRFAVIKLINIGSNILFNIFFLLLCPYLLKHHLGSWVHYVYKPKIGVGYVFIANLISSVLTLIMFTTDLGKIKMIFDFKLFKQMIKYALPLLVVGLAGSVNTVIDRILLKHLLPKGVNEMEQIGIYGANLKLAVLMTLFTQTFRYAAEPFFFSHAKETDSRKLYADVLKYFTIFGLLIFLGVMLFINVLKYFVDKHYFAGLNIVPILLIAYLMLGIIFNLSFWYKLTNRTQYGAYITVLGAVVTIGANFILIPFYGYTGAAWATFLAHLVMMIISYIYGQKYFYIKYDFKRIGMYFILAIILFVMSKYLPVKSLILSLLINAFFFSIFVAAVIYFENIQRFFIKKNMVHEN